MDYIIKISWSKYHGLPKTSNYGPKTIDLLQNLPLLQK